MLKKILDALKGLSPRNRILAGVGVIVAVLVIAMGAYFILSPGHPKPEPVKVQAPPPSPPPPQPPPPPPPEPVVEAPPPPPLPQLGESDSLVLDSLAALVDNKSLMKLLRADRIIRNIVATIDNLPGRQAPLRVLPVSRAPGKFIAAGGEDNLTISRRNASRYMSYVRFAEAVDTKKLVELYVRLYPLFQEAYEELGYPKKYFNERLMVALDDLLAAPDVKEPVRLVQPKVFYLYADPEMEARSIGQRSMMRTGSRNEAALKAKLGAFRQELMRHMSEGKIVNAGMPPSYPAESAVMASPAVK